MKYHISSSITGLANSSGPMVQRALRAEAELRDLCVITGLSREEIKAIVVKSPLSVGELVSFYRTWGRLYDRSQFEKVTAAVEDLFGFITGTNRESQEEMMDAPIDEVVKTIIGPDGKEMLAAHLTLGVQKVRRCGNKFYQLIWVNPNKKKAWFCKEDETEYRRKGEAVKAGEELVKKVGALRFSEVTR